ncbi:MAG: 7TM diverse intracellular signaling domain-containing protein [Lacibacter sp.]
MGKYRLLTCLFLVLMLKAFAQHDTSFPVIQSSSIQNVQFLTPKLRIYIDTAKNKLLSELNENMFQPLKKFPGKILPKQLMIDAKIYLLFKIKNDSAAERSYFFTPGTYAVESALYSRDSTKNEWIEIPQQKWEERNRESFHTFTISPGQSMAVLVSCNYARTNVSSFEPFLITPAFINYHINYTHTKAQGVNIFTYVICGMLLMMVFFSFANYFQNLKKEFLYYSVYALFFGVMLFLKAALFKTSSTFNFFYEEYFDYFLQMGGYVFYVAFSRMFLNTPLNYPLLNRMFLAAEVVLIIFLLLFSFFYFGGFSYPYLSFTENTSKYFFIFLGIMYLVLGIVKRNRLMNYLLAGNLANLIFGGISLLLVVFPLYSFLPKGEFARQSLTYFETGILLELILFLAGLTYKNKIELIEKVKMDEAIKQESEKQDYEKKIAILSTQRDERTRIAADMHDELGSGVTAIRLLSEIAIKKTRDNPVNEIQKISNNANELMSKMNAIIWSMNPGNDTVSSLISYIRSYASEYLDNFNIDYHVKVPVSLPETEVSGEKRRNVFLVIKETLNNIMKHSEATVVDILIHHNDELRIEISDNGKGIDHEKLNLFGNGLNNMKRRMETVGGTYEIRSGNGIVGTVTILVLPL